VSFTEQRLSGRSALVTGASSGIGQATALALAGAGMKVIATGRNGAALEDLARKGAGIDVVAGDLTDPRFVAALARRAEGVDLLVNNAGILKHAAILDGDAADWHAVFNLNVLSLLALTKPIAKAMVARGSGHIIIVSSLLARRVTPFTGIYAASKHAVAALVQGLRMELSPHGVDVVEIAPGLVRTNVLRHIDDPKVQDYYASRDFEWLSPQQVADAILYAAGATPPANLDLIEIRPHGQY